MREGIQVKKLHEQIRDMILSQAGSCATPEQLAVRFNMRLEDVRDGAQVKYSQGLLVFRRCQHGT